MQFQKTEKKAELTKKFLQFHTNPEIKNKLEIKQGQETQEILCLILLVSNMLQKEQIVSSQMSQQ
jgi:hypothetical protein